MSVVGNQTIDHTGHGVSNQRDQSACCVEYIREREREKEREIKTSKLNIYFSPLTRLLPNQPERDEQDKGVSAVFVCVFF